MAAIFASRRLPGRVPAQVCIVSRPVDDPLELRNCHGGRKTGAPPPPSEPTRPRPVSLAGPGTPPPPLPRAVAVAPPGRPGGRCRARGDEHVLRAGRGLPEVVDPALPLPGVAGGAQPREPFRLVALDRWVHAQRLVGLVTG